MLALAWAAGLAGVVAAPIDPLRTITEHQSVRALPLFALALAALAGLAFGRPGARPSPWLVAAFTLAIALAVDPHVLVHGTYVVPALAALAVLVLLRSARVPAVLACALVPAVLAADLARHDYSQQNPHQPAANWASTSQTFPQAPATARFLLQQRSAEGPSRFAWLVDDFTRRKQLRFVRGSDHADLMLGMSGTRFGLEDVAGYDPLQLSRYHDAIASSNGRQPSDRHFTWVERAPTRLLRRLGVRYYVAAPGLEPAGMTVVLRTPQATVVRDDEALPLARVNRPGRTDPARILVRDPDRVVIATPPGPAGRLVLADPPYPGWTVTIDGHSAPVRDQDGLFRAVDLPAGRHTVEWRFEPRSVKLRALHLARGAARRRGLRHRHAAPLGAQLLAQRLDERREPLGVERRRGAGADRERDDATARAEHRDLRAHALDAPAAGRREARVGRQARVEHVGVHVHVQRRVGR